jgi:uncharacterized membrane protein
MLNIVPLFLLNPPSRLKAAGEFLSAGSFALIVVGLYLRIGQIAVEATQSLSGTRAAPTTLATLLPAMPTWFIPENVFSFLTLIFVAVFGVYASLVAKKIDRIFR